MLCLAQVQSSSKKHHHFPPIASVSCLNHSPKTHGVQMYKWMDGEKVRIQADNTAYPGREGQDVEAEKKCHMPSLEEEIHGYNMSLLHI